MLQKSLKFYKLVKRDRKKTKPNTYTLDSICETMNKPTPMSNLQISHHIH